MEYLYCEKFEGDDVCEQMNTFLVEKMEIDASYVVNVTNHREGRKLIWTLWFTLSEGFLKSKRLGL